MLRIEGGSTQHYVDVLSKAEEILVDSGTNHRFVGGAIANPIGIDTTVVINAIQRTARIQSHGDLSLVRSDGSIRDLDAIGFSRFKDSYADARKRLKEESRKAKAQGLPYPPISIEPTHYANYWPGRNRIVQLVSTLDVDEAHRLHLTFGKIDQPTPWETMEPWQVTFDGGLQLTTLNLVGLPMRYQMRNPSGLKKKDLASIGVRNGKSFTKIDLLQKIASSVIEQGLTQGEDYEALYTTWRKFIDTLLNHPDCLTYYKAIVTRLYWNTVGTTLAHGTGILRPVANLGDRFTG